MFPNGLHLLSNFSAKRAKDQSDGRKVKKALTRVSLIYTALLIC